MSNKIKNFFKYAIMLSVTALLLWISFENIEVAEGASKVDYLLNVWSSANKSFLILSGLVAVLSHLIRAQRWKLLLNPIGYELTLKQGFLSVMIGYFINLAIPRGGEVSRCYNLYRLNKTPVDVSLGTVVAERVIDLIFLIILIAISFFIQLDSLILFFKSEEVQELTNQEGSGNMITIMIAGILFLAAMGLIFLFLLKRKKYLMLRLLSKSKSALLGIKDGVKSVLKLKSRSAFIIDSLLIWICYYLMMYFVMLAFPETENLGLGAALTIFVIGGIAMALPLPGGAGSFHVLVSTGLVLLYSLPQDKAIAFTFIFHGWQTVIIILVGAFSLISSQIIRTKIESNGQQN
ncbi:lysylphosphatidylglycerol synthase transmembrane domain-containing protein [Fulvivirga lutimaris]|uniref:lysylphosphatidylglycerol synthase transmembrane domain-containing protein n=1 Tax=Fulvivirga lutimaris TaxID=1819566 RepID=UPI0012BBB5EE|nr:lysylphosphatidylglycerol synthase transmembrane domain-containing protein [Fulvivirga lutimaris]MTI37941.1 flippase-like domain-containing protein [Fulvivirga lutimaris]